MVHPFNERPLTLFDVLATIWRYKWRVCLTFTVMFALAVVAVFLFPKKYESEAQLFVRLGRGSASLDPATMGQTISIQESRETEMNSILDMLKSRALAERVVDGIGVERLQKKYAWSEVQLEAWMDWGSEMVGEDFFGLLPPTEPVGELMAAELNQELEREETIKEFISNFKIDSPKKSTTINMAYRARQPELAQDVAEKIIEVYQEMHIEAYRSAGTLDFFDEELAKQEQLVEELEGELRETKNESGMVTLTGKQESLQTEITDVKKMQLQTKADLDAAVAKVAAIQRDLDLLPEELVSSKTEGIASNAADAMRDRLYALEIQEKELSSKYKSSDPRLIRVREQLQSAREIVSEQPTERPQTVTAINPVRQEMENELLTAKAGVASLSAKYDALLSLEEDLNARLREVNNLEILAQSQQRKIDIARENYQIYAKKMEESRINTALDRDSLSNVSVVGEPTLKFKHVSPKRSLLIVLGGIFAMLCGIMLALLSDYAAHARNLARAQKSQREGHLQGGLSVERADDQASVSGNGAQRASLEPSINRSAVLPTRAPESQISAPPSQELAHVQLERHASPAAENHMRTTDVGARNFSHSNAPGDHGSDGQRPEPATAGVATESDPDLDSPKKAK